MGLPLRPPPPIRAVEYDFLRKGGRQLYQQRHFRCNRRPFGRDRREESVERSRVFERLAVAGLGARNVQRNIGGKRRQPPEALAKIFDSGLADDTWIVRLCEVDSERKAVAPGDAPQAPGYSPSSFVVEAHPVDECEVLRQAKRARAPIPTRGPRAYRANLRKTESERRPE
jgi:hypothetical protein